jgi:hypothetical protein
MSILPAGLLAPSLSQGGWGPQVALRPFLERPGPGWSVPGPAPLSPPELDGVKSPARLTTTSGGFVIVEVRPAGEPARTCCSAQGLPSRNLTPLRCRREGRKSNGAWAPFAPIGGNSSSAAVSSNGPAHQHQRPIHLPPPIQLLAHRPRSTVPTRPMSLTAIQPSDCSTRVALEGQRASPRETRVVSTAVGAGSQSQQPSEQWGVQRQ